MIDFKKYVNETAIRNAAMALKGNVPFDHCIIDGFFKDSVAADIEGEFPSYNDPQWFVYNNKIENKKALNDWNRFPLTTYSVFQSLNSPEFVSFLSNITAMDLFPDSGLHGGGWHIHSSGGNLNPHLDYSIHPKLGLQRKFNIIIYLSSELKEGMGGELGLWSHDPINNRPGRLATEVQPKFNRAVLFDTTQNSWHGMSNKLNCPSDVYRKSLAIYYLSKPSEDASPHKRALFAARKEQLADKDVADLIDKRSDVNQSKSVYDLADKSDNI
jgi:Rps23 Pro-64 3,4-dihydroxylase Tpa1-like proline 4-hydroxylase